MRQSLKLNLLFIIALGLSCSLFGQTVFTYGNKAVSKEEFLKAFNKNPGVTGDRKKALQEYLDLYIKFKLKVQAAYDAGIHKEPTQQYEISNFRKQVADNILNEQASVNELAREAFERSRKEIHIAQIFVEVPLATDTTAAYKQISEAYRLLKTGKDFSELSAGISTGPAFKQSKGDLGFITVFSLPYAFENVIYSLKTGEFSAPVKSAFGYHILRNMDERPARGARKVAQILISTPPDAAADELKAAAAKADSIYSLVTRGADFAELARTLSNDLATSNNNGELNEFTTGTYSETFERAAFSLDKPGDVSRPFATPFGYHILKLVYARPPFQTFDDSASFYFKEKISRDSRIMLARKQYIRNLLPVIGYKPGTYKQSSLISYTDSALAGKKAGGVNDNSVLFMFHKHNVRAAEWIRFIKSVKGSAGNLSPGDFNKLYDDFLLAAAEEYYRENLQLYNKDFRNQVQDFTEANLLFAIMEQKVWNKASADTAGLALHYAANRSKYKWDTSADALIVTCSNLKLTEQLQQELGSDYHSWRQIISKYGSEVTVDSGRFELSQLPVVERTNFTVGLATAPVKNEMDSTYTFNYIIKRYGQDEPRSFEDAKGMVISDYQQVLEDRWVSLLKKKYPVKVNTAVFSALK